MSARMSRAGYDETASVEFKLHRRLIVACDKQTVSVTMQTLYSRDGKEPSLFGFGSGS